MAYSTLSYSVQDYSRELSSFAVYVDPALDPADLATLQAALLGVSLGQLQRRIEATTTLYGHDPATSPNSQREEKLLVTYQDATLFEVGTFTIPCFDKAGSTFVANTDYIDMTVGEAATLRTQLEANTISKYGFAIEVLSMKYVGRNS